MTVSSKNYLIVCLMISPKLIFLLNKSEMRQRKNVIEEGSVNHLWIPVVLVCNVIQSRAISGMVLCNVIQSRAISGMV